VTILQHLLSFFLRRITSPCLVMVHSLAGVSTGKKIILLTMWLRILGQVIVLLHLLIESLKF